TVHAITPLVYLTENGVDDPLSAQVLILRHSLCQPLRPIFLFGGVEGLENSVSAADKNVAGSQVNAAALIFDAGKESNDGAALPQQTVLPCVARNQKWRNVSCVYVMQAVASRVHQAEEAAQILL